ncbi:coagulation factor IXb [Sardina pilchardus]|uniref:coagulation factor IXb n=1 Tax=Sardina pilchardus TaxID=27697 RepID=UPI002E0F9045
MGKIFLSLLVVSLLVDKWFTYGASVFVSPQTASTVLRRQRRYNSGHLEEVMQRDNLERECIEEKCTWEEAREVFEDNAKTMEFWTGYIDGDQCESSPCQNGGRCQDGMSSYVCWCPSGFGGKNCEIEIARQCDVDNGGCEQFCVEDKVRGATCVCAPGYRRGPDKMNHCEPLSQYSCGRISKTIKNKLSGRSVIDAETVNLNDMSFNSPLNISNQTSSENNTLDLNGTASPVSLEVHSTQQPAVNNWTIPLWHFYPTTKTIIPESSIDERIVGGDEATRGEIPWQVAIINKATTVVFCGGSLLSEVWVITAAHCIAESKGPYFVRLGEHDTRQNENTERDHEVHMVFFHPRYDAKKSLYNHDIALLQLRNPVIFSDYIIPICLGPKDFTESILKGVDTSLVSGWGRTLFNGRDSPTLMKVGVPYVDRTECKGSSSDVSRFMFCAGYNTVKKDACQGDSGGPHASKYKDTWFLTGIVSWGEECAKEGKYGIYTRISRYFHWISNVTGLTNMSTK